MGVDSFLVSQFIQQYLWYNGIAYGISFSQVLCKFCFTVVRVQLVITFFIYACKDFAPVISNIRYNQRLLLIVIPFVQGVRE